MAETYIAEDQPLWVLHDLEDSPTGAELQEWPLHFTVLPFFYLNGLNPDTAFTIIRNTAHNVGPIVIEPGEQAMFGTNEDIPVTKVHNSEGKLNVLHTTLVNQLGSAGCRFVDLGYAMENYSPHITHNERFEVPKARYTAYNISVAQKLPKSAPHNKHILEKIDL